MADIHDSLSEIIDSASDFGGVEFSTSTTSGTYRGVLNLERSQLSMQAVGTDESVQAMLVCGRAQFGAEVLRYPFSVYVGDESWICTDIDEDAGSYRITLSKDQSRGFVL